MSEEAAPGLTSSIHNGIECGKIIYDSKDHNQWRYDFATKLASDKIAAKADHAILSVRKFPQGTRQLHLHDGVILANPARAVVLVQVVRDHIVKIAYAFGFTFTANAKSGMPKKRKWWLFEPHWNPAITKILSGMIGRKSS